MVTSEPKYKHFSCSLLEGLHYGVLFISRKICFKVVEVAKLFRQLEILDALIPSYQVDSINKSSDFRPVESIRWNPPSWPLYGH